MRKETHQLVFFFFFFYRISKNEKVRYKNSNKFTNTANIAYFTKSILTTNNFLSTTNYYVSARGCTIVYPYTIVKMRRGASSVMSILDSLIVPGLSTCIYLFIEGRWKFIGSFHLLKFDQIFFFFLSVLGLVENFSPDLATSWMRIIF